MTANITQNVVARSRNDHSLPAWKPSKKYQAGKISSATLTLTLGVIIVMSVAFLSFFYLGQVLGTASQGSDIADLEENIVHLREQQKELELEGAQLRSIQTIEDRVQELNLVATDKVTYLDNQEGRVATIAN